MPDHDLGNQRSQSLPRNASGEHQRTESTQFPGPGMPGSPVSLSRASMTVDTNQGEATSMCLGSEASHTSLLLAGTGCDQNLTSACDVNASAMRRNLRPRRTAPPVKSAVLATSAHDKTSQTAVLQSGSSPGLTGKLITCLAETSSLLIDLE